MGVWVPRWCLVPRLLPEEEVKSYTAPQSSQMYALLEPLCGSARQPGHGIGKHRSPTFTRVYVWRHVRQNTWLQAGTLKALGRAKIENTKCLDSSRTSSPHTPHLREESFPEASDVANRLEDTSPMAGARSKERQSHDSTLNCLHTFGGSCAYHKAIIMAKAVDQNGQIKSRQAMWSDDMHSPSDKLFPISFWLYPYVLGFFLGNSLPPRRNTKVPGLEGLIYDEILSPTVTIFGKILPQAAMSSLLLSYWGWGALPVVSCTRDEVGWSFLSFLSRKRSRWREWMDQVNVNQNMWVQSHCFL